MNRCWICCAWCRYQLPSELLLLPFSKSGNVRKRFVRKRLPERASMLCAVRSGSLDGTMVSSCCRSAMVWCGLMGPFKVADSFGVSGSHTLEPSCDTIAPCWCCVAVVVATEVDFVLVWVGWRGDGECFVCVARFGWFVVGGGWVFYWGIFLCQIVFDSMHKKMSNVLAYKKMDA